MAAGSGYTIEVVQGVEFRFEEVRSVVYLLSQKRERIERPTRLVTNFRSHAGILQCASAVLDLMFRLFPGSASVLGKDEGLCSGPRPAFLLDNVALAGKGTGPFHGDGSGSGSGSGGGSIGGGLLKRLLRNNPKIVVLCRDEQLDDGEGGSGSGAGGAGAVAASGSIGCVLGDTTLVLGIRAAKGMEFQVGLSLIR